VEAAFTSQFITLFIYDAPLPIATRIFEMFLVEGEQVILDFIAGLIETQY
jgi:Rab-GTPase-TBC domain